MKAELLGIEPRQYRLRKRQELLGRLVSSPAFNVPVALLILISVAFIFAEFFVPPSQGKDIIAFTNDILTWVFIVELFLRYIAAPNKRVFFANYWIDILAVSPGLRLFRAFRVLRLLRLLRLTRVLLIFMRHSGYLSTTMERYFGSLGTLFLTSVMLIFSAGLLSLTIADSTGVTQFSLDTYFSRVWETTFLFMAGELVGTNPTSIAERVLALVVAFSGLIVFALFVGTVSATMTNYFGKKMDTKDMSVGDLRGHIIVCGWDRMGAVILSELEAIPDVWLRGVVVVSESTDDILKEVKIRNSRRLFHVRDDYTRMDVLERVGAKHAQTALILADKGAHLRDQDRDARTVLAALTLEKLNPSIFTCCELLDEQNATHLEIAGVEEIISPATLTASLFAATAVNTGVTSVIKNILTHHEGSYIKKVNVPKGFIGKTFFEAFSHFKQEFGAIILGIENKNDSNSFTQHVNPDSGTLLMASDKLILVLRLDSVLCELAPGVGSD